MGFTAIATTAAALPKVFEAAALHQQSKNLNAAATAQQKLSNATAQNITGAAMDNQRRATRNAQMQMGALRADAAASQLAEDGTAHVRELDMATRLQDEITNQANASLQQANSIRQQGALNAWETRTAAQRSKASSLGSLLSAAGSAIGSTADALNKKQNR